MLDTRDDASRLAYRCLWIAMLVLAIDVIYNLCK